jgi:hypothetical protein
MYVGLNEDAARENARIFFEGNLFLECEKASNRASLEFKMGEVIFKKNTMMKGNYDIRFRHSWRHQCYENLFIAAGGGFSFRDRESLCINNGSYTESGGLGNNAIDLHAGSMTVQGYPPYENSTFGKIKFPDDKSNMKGHAWPAVFEIECGGNDMPVNVGTQAPGRAPVHAQNNNVPNTGRSRNRSVKLIFQKDTNLNAVIPDADINIPKGLRYLRPTEVGTGRGTAN